MSTEWKQLRRLSWTKHQIKALSLVKICVWSFRCNQFGDNKCYKFSRHGNNSVSIIKKGGSPLQRLIYGDSAVPRKTRYNFGCDKTYRMSKKSNQHRTHPQETRPSLKMLIKEYFFSHIRKLQPSQPQRKTCRAIVDPADHKRSSATVQTTHTFVLALAELIAPSKIRPTPTWTFYGWSTFFNYVLIYL